jgi:hypothetical protein
MADYRGFSAIQSPFGVIGIQNGIPFVDSEDTFSKPNRPLGSGRLGEEGGTIMNHRKSIAVLVALTVVVVFAAAASAYAMPGPQGTVYGQATMQPTVSVTLTGTGSDLGVPLTYSGRKGETVWANNEGSVLVTNTGDMFTTMLLGYGSDPTDGNTTWRLGEDCNWTFVGESISDVPALDSGPRPLIFNMGPGGSRWVSTRFTFPNNYDGSTHTMTALIIAEPEI